MIAVKAKQDAIMQPNYFNQADAPPLGEYTEDTNGPAIEVAAYNHLVAYLHCSNVTTDDDVTVKFQDSPDQENWHDTGDAFSAVTDSGIHRVELGAVGRFLRAVATLSGSASTASLTTALTGTDNDLTFTAKSSSAGGNDITVAYVDPAEASQALEVVTTDSNIVVNLATSSGAVATGSVTSTANGNPVEDETVVTGSVTYRFRDTLAQANDVKIGADGNATLTNLKAALNGEEGEGTTYGTGTMANPDVTAPQNPGNFVADWVLTVEAVELGAAGNALVLTESATNITVSGTGTLSSGADVAVTSTAADVKTAIEADEDGNALVTIANAAANDGSGVVTAMEATHLEGGEARGATFEVVASAKN